MQSFWLSFEIVVPLFLLLGLGWLLRRWEVLGESTLNQINDLCFKVLLPSMMFRNLYNTALSELAVGKLLLFSLGCQVLILILLFLTIPRLEPRRPARGSMIQGIFRINFIVFGFAIAEAFGDSGQMGIVSVLAAVLIPFFNLVTVFILEYYRGDRGSWAELGKSVLTNPFVVAFLISLVFVCTGIRLPSVVERALEDVSKMATPISLIALGGCINFSAAKQYRKQLAITVAGRLVVIPALFLPLCIAAGFRGAELLALTIMLIPPTAVSSFNLARKMDADAELAGHIIVFQSAFSLITIFLWIWLLGITGYL